jgi:hypothetical protein
MSDEKSKINGIRVVSHENKLKTDGTFDYTVYKMRVTKENKETHEVTLRFSEIASVADRLTVIEAELNQKKHADLASKNLPTSAPGKRWKLFWDHSKETFIEGRVTAWNTYFLELFECAYFAKGTLGFLRWATQGDKFRGAIDAKFYHATGQ